MYIAYTIYTLCTQLLYLYYIYITYTMHSIIPHSLIKDINFICRYPILASLTNDWTSNNNKS